ncbi:MAG: hypothetical protein ABSA90_02390 [Xanthobacteraceae bacterium]|jgi:hypothetical protein
MKRLCLSAALLAAFAIAASAQTIVVNPRQSMAPVSAEQIRVMVGVNTFVPAPADNGEEVVKAQEAARRMIYELAAHECAILLDVLASECRLESVNVNVQRAPGNQFAAQQRAEGFNMNGNVVFRVVAK